MSILELDQKRQYTILNSALKEFAEKGYELASTNRIAKEAGLSKALMFHYVRSKQELFLYVYDYFYTLLDKEYHQVLNYEERDIFDRLQQSYRLQLNLLKQYPWIFELNKLNALTNHEALNNEIERRQVQREATCYPKLFASFDKTKFREDIDIEKCKQVIYWTYTGFAQQMLEDIRNTTQEAIVTQPLEDALIDLTTQLKVLFYKQESRRA